MVLYQRQTTFHRQNGLLIKRDQGMNITSFKSASALIVSLLLEMFQSWMQSDLYRHRSCQADNFQQFVRNDIHSLAYLTKLMNPWLLVYVCSIIHLLYHIALSVCPVLLHFDTVSMASFVSSAKVTDSLSQMVSSCCGLQAYNSLNEICCERNVVAKPTPNPKCCGKG